MDPARRVVAVADVVLVEAAVDVDVDVEAVVAVAVAVVKVVDHPAEERLVVWAIFGIVGLRGRQSLFRGKRRG